MTGPSFDADPAPGDPAPTPTVRRLFLDDDPARAGEFLAVYPDAVWVSTAADCIARLAEPWDEVHLDHDLGGEQHVDVARDDCGMAVVRWLSLEPRPHLRRARFFVHSHNGVAAYVMMLQLKGQGLSASASPFGEGRWKPAAVAPVSFWGRVLARFPRWVAWPRLRGHVPSHPGHGHEAVAMPPRASDDAPGCQADGT